MAGPKRRWDSNQRILQGFALMGVLWYLLFYYVPYAGLTIAFKDFKLTDSIFGGQWVGLKYFQELFTDFELPKAIRNTVLISLLKLCINFPAAILFALLINELPWMRFKKIVQTISYFPHFVNWIILSLMILYWFSPEFGLINTTLMQLGLIQRPITVLTDADAFYGLATFSELWKETGWNSILFIAAIAGIDPSLYEAALVDGASRWQRMLHITLPSIMGAIILVFLLNFAGIFSGLGAIFEQSMLLGNSLNYDRSIVLSLYTMKTGISLGRFSFATAVGLTNGVVSLTLLLTGNALCKKFFGRGLYTGGGGQ